MGYDLSTRKQLGSSFSEGTRLLWKAVAESGVSRTAFAKSIGCSRQFFHRMLYGEVKPGRSVAARIEEVAGIEPTLFDEEPKRPFVPPAGRRPSTTPPRAA